ncbi:MAG TPA: hypothetical protein VFJ02_18225 [Vicinamibacterales bacterium]|nr:hypothetical protein [Vicinamibacterales bacterium]
MLAATEDREYKVELTLDGDEMKGTLTRRAHWPTGGQAAEAMIV